MKSASRELANIRRRQARADARFRGEEPGAQGEEVSPQELVLGGAFAGLLLMAMIAAILAATGAAGAAGASTRRRNR